MKNIFLLAALGFASVVGLNAQQSISFSSEVGSGTASTGSAWAPDVYTFELGAFVTGFTPTSANVAQWDANWVSLGTTKWLDDGGDLYYIGAASVLAYDATFKASTQLFVWGYDSLSNASNEWILMTSTSWVVAADISNPVSSDYITSQPGLSTVVGSVSGNGSVLASSKVTLAAIPEPSSFAALAGLGILGAVATRRRRSA